MREMVRRNKINYDAWGAYVVLWVVLKLELIAIPIGEDFI